MILKRYLSVMMEIRVFLSLAILLCAASATIFQVSSPAQLRAALGSAEPGDVINIADGNYTGGKFIATKSGASGNPIIIKGGKNATLSGTPYGFYVQGASYLNVSGFSVALSLKGIVLDGANHIVIDDVEVHNTQQEGVHFRFNSADNIIQNSYIHHTGVRDPGYGEGVYLGSAISNWPNGVADKSDRNQVLNNKIGPSVQAECVDIKEGSSGGIIRGNTFTGPESGQNYADSWIDIKGTGYTIENNTGTAPLKDGIQIHKISNVPDSGCNNIIQNNQCSGVPAGGACVINSAGCNNTIRNNV